MRGGAAMTLRKKVMRYAATALGRISREAQSSKASKRTPRSAAGTSAAPTL